METEKKPDFLIIAINYTASGPNNLAYPMPHSPTEGEAG